MGRPDCNSSRRCAQRGVAPPVVMISGSTDPAAVAALRGSGLPWLTKPVDPRALRSTLIDALGR